MAQNLPRLKELAVNEKILPGGGRMKPILRCLCGMFLIIATALAILRVGFFCAKTEARPKLSVNEKTANQVKVWEGKITTGLPFDIKEPLYRCKRCGKEANAIGFRFTYQEHNRDYCYFCFMKLLDKHVGQVEKLEAK